MRIHCSLKSMDRKIKIILVSLYNRLNDYPTKYSLSSMRLVAFIKAQPSLADLEVKILPLDLNQSANKLADAIIKTGASIVGLSCYMWTSVKCREIAKIISKTTPGALIIAGGPDTAVFDNKTWPSNVLFVLGEGEGPLKWILEKRKKKLKLIGRNAIELHAAVYSHFKDRSMAKTEISDTIKIGVPLYSEKFMPVFYEFSENDKFFTWHDTAIGCAYRCGYCGHRTRPNIALRSDTLVMEEIKNINKLKFKNVFIIDPILGGLPGRYNSILKMYQKYAPESAISAYFRAEYFNDETIEILSRSNLKEILIGLQSTNSNIPNWLRGNNLQMVKKYLPKLSQNNIFNRIELITGLPGDTLAGQRESLRFVLEEVCPMSIWSYHLTVIPGTKLYEILDADKRGQNLWIHADPLNSRAVESSSYSSSELDYMLIYAGAITSLYNAIKMKRVKGFTDKRLKIKQLEEIIIPAIKTKNLEIINHFRTSNMSEVMSYWSERI